MFTLASRPRPDPMFPPTDYTSYLNISLPDFHRGLDALSKGIQLQYQEETGAWQGFEIVHEKQHTTMMKSKDQESFGEAEVVDYMISVTASPSLSKRVFTIDNEKTDDFSDNLKELYHSGHKKGLFIPSDTEEVKKLAGTDFFIDSNGQISVPGLHQGEVFISLLSHKPMRGKVTFDNGGSSITGVLLPFSFEAVIALPGGTRASKLSRFATTEDKVTVP